MKKISLVLVTSMMLLALVSFAQTFPQPPASWSAYKEKENAKRAALSKQNMKQEDLNKIIKDDTNAFLKSHPEVNAYFDQVRAAVKAQMAASKAAHQNKTGK